MNTTNTVKITTAVAGCASGIFLALLATASTAGADPADPAPPPPPVPAPMLVVPVPGPAPGPDAIVQAAAPDAALAPPDGTPHLASPDALPPGSTMDPQDADSPNVSYLKDLWQAVQNHEISGKEALIMGVAQRGMDTPIPAQAPGPNVPLRPVDPALAPPPPPDAPPPVTPVLPSP